MVIEMRAGDDMEQACDPEGKLEDIKLAPETDSIIPAFTSLVKIFER